MKAVILAGGLGTRMREETEYKPKPMVEIGGKPVLWHIMKNFAFYGITEFVICLGYKGEIIKDYFINYATRNSNFEIDLLASSATPLDPKLPNWKVSLVDTGAETTTAGRIILVKDLLEGSNFLCTYGDGLADVNVSNLIRFHESHGKVATVTAVQPSSRFGLLELDDDDSVNGFSEKPILKDWINGGYFCFSNSVFDYLDFNSPLEVGPLSRISENGQLKAFKHEGFWQPMDTYREYVELNKMWNDGEAKWKTWSD